MQPAPLKNIDAKSFNVEHLLADFEGFDIPELQRPYAWTTDTVNAYVDDLLVIISLLKQSPEDRSEHLFGMVVSIGGANGVQQVVDGQQRLTTTTLTLGLLKKQFEHLSTTLIDGPQRDLGVQCAVAAQQLDQLLYRSTKGGVKVPRLSPATEVRGTYESFLAGGNGSVANEKLGPAKKLREAAEIIKTRLLNHPDRNSPVGPATEFKYLERVKEVVLHRLKIVHVRTESREAGYGLFETLNTRGERLNALDLVKVWMLSQLAGTPVEATVAQQFRGLANDDTRAELEYLRDFFRARAFRSPNERNEVTFSSDVRRYLFSDPALVGAQHPAKGQASESKLKAEAQNRVVAQVDTMESWYDLWLQLKQHEMPYSPPTGAVDRQRHDFGQRSLHQVLSGFSHTLPMPLLLQAAARIGFADFSRMLHLIELFFFRFKKIGSGAAGTMEAVYLKHARSIDTVKKINFALLQTDMQEAIDSGCPDLRFSSRLAEGLRTDIGGHGPKLKYFLQTLDRYATAPIPSLDPHFPTGTAIACVEPDETKFDDPADMHRLGNLILLTESERKALGDLGFEGKKKSLGTNGLTSPTSTAAFKARAWGSKAVAHREQELINRGLQVFSFSSNLWQHDN